MGILANSVTVTHASSSATDIKAGYIVNERIVLTSSTSSSSYEWLLAAPSSSASARSALSSSSGSSVTFTPDVDGHYLLMCTLADGTVFQLRITVLPVSSSTLTTIVRFTPLADAQVTAPTAGVTLYYSSDQSALVIKRADGSVYPIEIGAAV